MPTPQVVICISGSYMIDTLFPPSVADFYEKKLAAKGVMFARNMRFKSASCTVYLISCNQRPRSLHSFPFVRMLGRPCLHCMPSLIFLVPTPPLRFVCPPAVQSGGLWRSMASSPPWAATPSTSSPSSLGPSESAVRRLTPAILSCDCLALPFHSTC
jgi:hypothetical protein